MTPRNPWRRRVRDELVPVLWLLATAILIGVALGQCIAHADPAPTPTLSAGDVFAIDHGADVCIGLDHDPTVAGVVRQIAMLRAFGLSGHDAGVALADSVLYVCPIHRGIVREFISRYRNGTLA